MNMEERIARINELYHKSQGAGLTAEEKEEQARLRREYVDSIKRNLKSQLDNIVIEKPDGSMVDLGQKYGGKSGKQETENGGNMPEAESRQETENGGNMPEAECGRQADPGREAPKSEGSQESNPDRENAESGNGQGSEPGEEAPGTGGRHE